MHFDINMAQLVHDALLLSGCDQALLNDFDGHSTIELGFTNVPNILISVVDDQVVIWSQIGDYNDNVIKQCADRILPMLMKPVAFSVTGQLQLDNDEHYLILKGCVKANQLEAEKFGAALEEFYCFLDEFNKVFV